MTIGQYTIVLQNQNLRKFMTPVGQFIFRKRHALNMTQSELAQKSGVDGSYINRIEKGGKRPGNLIFLERLSRSLQLSSEEEKKLFAAAKLSQRTVRLPANLSLSAYAVADNFISALVEMSDEQIQLFDTILNGIRHAAIGAPYRTAAFQAKDFSSREESMYK